MLKQVQHDKLSMSSKNQLIRTIYLYAVSLITLIMIIYAASSLINLGLKTWIFTKADKNIYYDYPMMAEDPKTGLPTTEETKARLEKEQTERNQIQKQIEAVRSFSMLLVAVPVFLFHWRLAKKDKEENN